MKVAIECDSPLLQKSLENFLEGYLSSSHSCDMILSDHEIAGKSNVLRIGSDKDAYIQKPFSKSQLLLKLEHYYKTEQEALDALSIVDSFDEEIVAEEKPKFESATLAGLEDKIERLTRQYTKGIMSLIKEYHEQK